MNMEYGRFVAEIVRSLLFNPDSNSIAVTDLVRVSEIVIEARLNHVAGFQERDRLTRRLHPDPLLKLLGIATSPPSDMRQPLRWITLVVQPNPHDSPSLDRMTSSGYGSPASKLIRPRFSGDQKTSSPTGGPSGRVPGFTPAIFSTAVASIRAFSVRAAETRRVSTRTLASMVASPAAPSLGRTPQASAPPHRLTRSRRS